MMLLHSLSLLMISQASTCCIRFDLVIRQMTAISYDGYSHAVTDAYCVINNVHLSYQPRLHRSWSVNECSECHEFGLDCACLVPWWCWNGIQCAIRGLMLFYTQKFSLHKKYTQLTAYKSRTLLIRTYIVDKSCKSWVSRSVIRMIWCLDAQVQRLVHYTNQTAVWSCCRPMIQ